MLFKIFNATILKHIFWMIIGCTLPLLYFAPALGLNSNISFFVFMLAMFACHLLMPMQHGGHKHDEQKQNSSTEKSERHEH